MVTIIGSWHSWANSMPVPISKATLCLVDLWIDQVDDHILIVPHRLGPWALVPLDSAKAPPLWVKALSPQTEMAPTPLTGVIGQPPGNQPLLAKAGNRPLLGPLLNCPLG